VAHGLPMIRLSLMVLEHRLSGPLLSELSHRTECRRSAQCFRGGSRKPVEGGIK
jgi:hypothetical protein